MSDEESKSSRRGRATATEKQVVISTCARKSSPSPCRIGLLSFLTLCIKQILRCEWYGPGNNDNENIARHCNGEDFPYALDCVGDFRARLGQFRELVLHWSSEHRCRRVPSDRCPRWHFATRPGQTRDTEQKILTYNTFCSTQSKTPRRSRRPPG